MFSLYILSPLNTVHCHTLDHSVYLLLGELLNEILLPFNLINFNIIKSYFYSC